MADFSVLAGLAILLVITLSYILFRARRQALPPPKTTERALPGSAEEKSEAAVRPQLESGREAETEALELSDLGEGEDLAPPSKLSSAPPPIPSDARSEAPSPALSAPAPSLAPAPGEEATPEEVALVRRSLAPTRNRLIHGLAKLFGGQRNIDPALLEEAEDLLVASDVGIQTAQKLLEQVRQENRSDDPAAIWAAIRREAKTLLGAPAGGIKLPHRPTVVLVVGVNGVGKTTTIGKLAARFSQEGKKVILAAGDTFRAAAVLQLEAWGRRVGCEVVRGKDNADPGSVLFAAIRKAREEGADLVLADTAGRLHTKAPLMDELRKIYRSVEKALDGRAPDEVLLVIDATNGQNALQQVRLFKEALPLSGLALTKLDGSAKGGVVLAVADEHQIPIRYIGVGERVEDLRIFQPSAFVDALFEKPEDDTAAA